MFSKKYIVLGLGFLVVAMVTAQTRQPADNAPDATDNDEVEFDNAEEEDDKFDSEIVTTALRPGSRPNVNAVRAGFQRQPGRPSVNPTSVNPYVEYYIQSQWARTYKCCPRRQGFGCRTYRRRLPCFFEFTNKEWCCPIWPTVYIHNCNCMNCAVIGPNDCVTTGKCRRRYRRTRFWAVCYRRCGWAVFRRFDKYLPSSCYCRPYSGYCHRPW